jgi:3-phenylpropionate/cinnamic acid dioxygenase small subunit
MSNDDRTAIIDLTIAYCWALDEHDWDVLRRVFTPDASASLGVAPAVGIEAIIERVSTVLTPLDDSQHMVTNHQVAIDGDRATCRCYFHAQHIRAAAAGSPNFIVAGRYEDELVRTADGWRIAKRHLEPMWREGNIAVVRGDR